MEFIKRLFKTNKRPIDSWTMLGTSKSEVNELLVYTGQLTIGDDFLKIENYPFEPSIAYRQKILNKDQIDDVDFKSYPPTFSIDNELIFLSSEKKVELYPTRQVHINCGCAKPRCFAGKMNRRKAEG